MAVLALTLICQSNHSAGSNSNVTAVQNRGLGECYINLASGVIYGIYALDQLIRNNPAQSRGHGELLPEVSVRLGKGSLEELILSKTLCGATIYSAKFITEMLEQVSFPAAGELIYVVTLIPALYQHNQKFNYDEASLPTVLTLFSTKTSAKLLEQNLQSYTLGNEASGAIIMSGALTLWLVATASQGAGSTPTFFWIALPKFYMSAALSQFYKATGKRDSSGPLFSGLVWYGIGSLVSQGVSHNLLPKLSGLTESFAGKSQKLLGYGLADAIKQAVDASTLPAELKKSVSYLLIYQLTSIIDIGLRHLPDDILLKGLRRGIVVRLVLLKVELAFQAGDLLAGVLSDPHLGTIREISHVVNEKFDPESEEGCIVVPVNGMATAMYHSYCYNFEETAPSAPLSASPDLEWLTFIFIL